MTSLHHHHPIYHLITLCLLLPITLAATCTTPKKLTSTSPATVYTSCTQLPTLSSTLHYTYLPTNKTLLVAFTAAPSSPSGWVSWGINPTGTGMLGSQAILASTSSAADGALSVKTFNLSSYAVTSSGNLSFPVYAKSAELNSDGSITIHASVMSDGGKINHVWQVGPGVTKDGIPLKHDINPPNLQSKATLDLSSGPSSASSSSLSSGGATGAADAAALHKRNIHGILNAVSWGILFPFGAIISRYLKVFEFADPAWFYLHATCQTSAYAIGVAGWTTGLELGSSTKGIVFKGHRCIGFVLFCIATLQIFALLLRPKKDHKYRLYWNIYHHCIGYAILILGIINIFKGFDILQPEKKWKSTYVTILIVLVCIAVLLEAFTWIVILRRKSNRSAKPYA